MRWSFSGIDAVCVFHLLSYGKLKSMGKKKTWSLASWNVNGLRAAERKGFLEWLKDGRYDVVALQETKISTPEQLSENFKNPNGYTSYFHCATEKKGYSGVAIFSKKEPRSVRTYFENFPLLSTEGRVIEVEFEQCTLLGVYFPNGGGGAERLRYKLEFYDQFLLYITGLVQSGKNVVFCGDINTAHNEIDLARPKENEKNTGFLRVERDWMDALVNAGFCDTYRTLHPEKVEYSWWDLKTRARLRNVGWRLDYFFVNQAFFPKVEKALILGDVMGSDHCPVTLELSL